MLVFKFFIFFIGDLLVFKSCCNFNGDVIMCFWVLFFDGLLNVDFLYSVFYWKNFYMYYIVLVFD